MMRRNRLFGIFSLLVFTLNLSIAQVGIDTSYQVLSPVFIIGEHEKPYEILVSNTKSNLYEVCDNSMEIAFAAWQDMLIQIGKYAEQQNMDINGVKIWMNTFWNKNGTIKHIVYYPKLNSKNVDFGELTKLLESFMNEFQLPYQNEVSFAHYGQASFPVFPIRISDNK